jgi:membrane fusion protein, multidrug efflux system
MNAINRRFKHILLFVLFTSGSLILPSCGGKTSTEDDPDQIRQQISDYQSQINELTLQVNILDRKLEQLGEQPRSRFQLPVTVIEIEESNFEQYVEATSTVEAVQTMFISPETSGQVQQILVEKGQRVRTGQLLARLNTSVIESSMDEVKTSLTLAKTVYERQKGLWDQQIGSEIQFLESQNAVKSLESRLTTLESQLQMAVMRAPFDGVVDDIYVKVGELAMPGTRIMHIVNLNKLYINADVSESYLGTVSKGDKVILRFPAFADLDMQVPVHRVGHVIKPENRTFLVQLLIDNPGEKFKPNMMARMAIKTFTQTESIAIPSMLIKQDIQGHYVYVARRENDEVSADKVYIERGPDGEGKTKVLSGLNTGDLLINRGHNQVANGSLLRIDTAQDVVSAR